MRPRFVLRQFGFLTVLLSICMLPAAVWAFYFHCHQEPGETAALAAFGISALIGIALGFAMVIFGRRGGTQLGRREALLLVAASWTFGAALAALPFFIWARLHDFLPEQDVAFTSYVNCYFEAMSGLTTTGASILGTGGGIESVPKSLLFWRAFTHWIGGLGIVVLFVAVLPLLGVGGKRLFRVESPGPVAEGVRPRIRAAAQALWLIYLGLTVAELIALKLAGMDWFDSLCHTFATLATGGFSTKNTSIGFFPAWPVQAVIIVFMILAGVNFSLYYRAAAGRWREASRDPELRAYLLIMLVATVAVTFIICRDTLPTMRPGEVETGLLAAVRHALFHVVSIQTTTGFSTADFHQWDFPAKAILMTLMFVGASAGSTGGGVKVVRCLITAKVLWAEIETVFRPHVVRTVRVGRYAVDANMRSGTLVYVLLIGVVFVVGAGLLMGIEGSRTGSVGDAAGFPRPISVTTAASAAAATLNNIGPGFDLVGPTVHYAWFSAPSKIVMCVLMALGRLELYAFLVLVMPQFWREE